MVAGRKSENETVCKPKCHAEDPPNPVPPKSSLSHAMQQGSHLRPKVQNVCLSLFLCAVAGIFFLLPSWILPVSGSGITPSEASLHPGGRWRVRVRVRFLNGMIQELELELEFEWNGMKCQNAQSVAPTNQRQTDRMPRRNAAPARQRATPRARTRARNAPHAVAQHARTRTSRTRAPAKTNARKTRAHAAKHINKNEEE